MNKIVRVLCAQVDTEKETTDLCTSHLHCHPKALHHFIGTHAKDVDSDNLLIDTCTNELHESFGLLLRFKIEDAVEEITEL